MYQGALFASLDVYAGIARLVFALFCMQRNDLEMAVDIFDQVLRARIARYGGTSRDAVLSEGYRS